MKAKIVGILNYTPDSFSDGSDYFDLECALKQVKRLVYEGISVLEIGAESTRPGAKPITAEEEWSRLSKLVPEVVKYCSPFGIDISVDTYHYENVIKSLNCGVSFINDVSGFY